MGQAKVRREALRQMMLEQSKEWDFPPSPWEASVCAELKERDVVVVPRASPDELAAARMPSNHCHTNVRWYVENDPSQKARAVVGWRIGWPNFVLHSVIEREGQLICITPSAIIEKEFPFIPDSKISWIEDGDVYSAIRDGRKIELGVRVFPEFTMAQCAILRERLLSGIDPRKAANFSNEEMEELKRRYIPRLGVRRVD